MAGTSSSAYRPIEAPPTVFLRDAWIGLWGEVGHMACNVCLVALWLGCRAKSCGVLAAPCTYGDPEPLLAAPLQRRTQN